MVTKDNTKTVNIYEFGNEPISDNCENIKYNCTLEEDISENM